MSKSKPVRKPEDYGVIGVGFDKPAPQTSPLPWLVHPIEEAGKHPDGSFRRRVVFEIVRSENGALGGLIGKIGEGHEADAALIVHRVNAGPSVDAKLAAFEAMVEAVTELRDVLEGKFGTIKMSGDAHLLALYSTAAGKCAAALKLAQEVK